MLQESGETESVLQIGYNLLRERLPKSFKRDVVLAMALAYVDISRDAMADSPPSFIEGCDALERSLKLLHVSPSKTNFLFRTNLSELITRIFSSL